ncbi:Asp23/Gls24 family envelope stress response protein [Streptomyces sp. SID8366]|uniref:DUF6286 domain-containing Asp23/Gls24 family envelope stress response protein n=1 Tax=unclassified Streptomyces TaxID=2593676 RepID=UPI000DB9D5A0|nr:MULTISPECIES: DUF6286 domain-containing protein [unclassified Streptomyces]MYU06846.1 Asp23/Gls24 family envelope stress response protein [Streptomyces sp. SID8366]MYU64696.1 Asp23/Gls24 family envelope stress response protein [Streptomyces sp. SID69]RAJ48897.1 putative alkaline shock family protein YloU [Streptomyces sp. PsTaAH-130]
MTAPARRGTTVVTGKAVRKIAERAAGEALSGRPVGSAGGSATVRGRRATVAVRVALPYPVPLSDTTRRVQEHVVDRTRALTGLEVGSSEVSVTRLVLPTAQRSAIAEDGTAAGVPAAQTPRSPRRWWSQRRAPMAVLTLAAAAVCAAITADVIRVHATHHRAAEWRMRLVEWLAGHAPGDAPVVLVGVVVALFGVWMTVLALTPGRRQQMPLTVTTRGWSAAVDRYALATLVRDTVGDVPGIEAATVRVRRRRVKVRAHLAFGDREAAREQVVAAARQALAGCGLSRTPRLKVTVTLEPTWQPSGLDRADIPPRTPATGEPGLVAAEGVR